jgi:hypothetical protein
MQVIELRLPEVALEDRLWMPALLPELPLTV